MRCCGVGYRDKSGLGGTNGILDAMRLDFKTLTRLESDDISNCISSSASLGLRERDDFCSSFCLEEGYLFRSSTGLGESYLFRSYTGLGESYLSRSFICLEGFRGA